jgi:hypothetical protein
MSTEDAFSRSFGRWRFNNGSIRIRREHIKGVHVWSDERRHLNGLAMAVACPREPMEEAE